MSNKIYLGCGIFAETDSRVQGAVILTNRMGAVGSRREARGEMYLNSRVLAALDRYRAALKVAHEVVPDMMGALKPRAKPPERP